MEFSKPYIDNRELSWLKFNERVLEEAEDDSVPLFDRLRFVYIFCNNLDEFFMIRVGYLRERVNLKKEAIDNKTNLTAAEQLKLIAKKTANLVRVKDKVHKEIKKQLNETGLIKVDLSGALPEYDDAFLEEYFTREVRPLLTPSIIDKKHPVPFLRNKEIYVAAVLRSANSAKESVGILPATAEGAFGRVVWLPPRGGKQRFVLTEELIKRYADLVFTNCDILGKCAFRITRNADISVNEALIEHDIDFRDVMEELLKKRIKLAPVRIEFDSGDKEITGAVSRQLKLDLGEEYVFSQSSPLDMSFIFEIESKISSHAELFFNPLSPQPPASVNENDPMLRQIERGDILLHYPFESMRPFIRMLEEAAKDPDVFSIKITLYRLADDSKIIDALITAAENGKQVLALLELRARFDEENNISWSKRLEDAGAQVIYGLDELKVHSKLLLITKKQGSAIRYFTQIGTGNYNEKTSKIYTDLSLITANQDIGADASLFFNALSVGTTVESTNMLWVAPRCLKSRVVEMIDTEITKGQDGYIGLKLNSLTDKDLIEKLVEASKKGVKIELIIRGISCLVAGVPGYTENIRLTSIVGRFLEHSRVYIFGRGSSARVYISSADFMTRNTERRVEVAAPVRDLRIKAKLIEDFSTMVIDNVKARIQNADGSYIKIKPGKSAKLDTQIYFYERAYENAKNAEEKRAENWFVKMFGRFFK